MEVGLCDSIITDALRMHTGLVRTATHFGRPTMQVLADDDKGLVKILAFAGRETVQ
jgi:hypothetical protein